MHIFSFQDQDFTIKINNNSTLRLERQKRGNAQGASSSSHEAEGDRELSSARVRTRGRRPRIFTARESYRARERRPEAVGRGLSPCESENFIDKVKISNKTNEDFFLIFLYGNMKKRFFSSSLRFSLLS